MLKNFDTRLFEALKKKLVQEGQLSTRIWVEKYLGGKNTGETSSFEDLEKIRVEVSKIADPDFLEICPDLLRIFEAVSSEVKQMDIEEKDEILYALSVARKNTGFDKRYRDLTRGTDLSSSAAEGPSIWRD